MAAPVSGNMTLQCASCLQPMLVPMNSPPGSAVACPSCGAANAVPGQQMQQGYGQTVVVMQQGCPPHSFVDTNEPTTCAWVICLLTCFWCSLCICTKQKCTKCGLSHDG